MPDPFESIVRGFSASGRKKTDRFRQMSRPFARTRSSSRTGNDSPSLESLGIGSHSEIQMIMLRRPAVAKAP